MDDLPQAQRAVIVLRDVEGFSTRETAEMLGITGRGGKDASESGSCHHYPSVRASTGEQR